MTKPTSNKNDVVLKIIDNTLNQIFGKEATTLIYRHLESQYSVKHSEIGDKIDLFARGLEDFLKSGAYVVEKKILEDINSNCKLLRRMELENFDDEANFVAHVKSFMHHA
jgi:hypothetical protein